jgi:hyperosmotically inducible protein
MFARVIAAASLVLAMSAPTWAADTNNLQVLRDAQKKTLTYAQLTVFDSVHMNVDNGVVTLSGWVTMPYKSSDLAKRVASAPGVTQVVNQIEVLPVSQWDDTLRMRIARAIYGNSTFWRYGAMANPPIRIVVENGHVTLDGVVNNEVERMMARSLATGFGEFSLTNALKTDAEVERELERL